MTNSVAVQEKNEVVVYSRIELKAVRMGEKVKELIIEGNTEFTLFNTVTPFNLFHEDDTHISFNSLTVVVDGMERVIPIDAHNIDIEYNEVENTFVAHFSINTDINLNILNNSEIKPFEVLVTGWDYNTGDTEEFFDIAVETELIASEFVDEY